MQQQTTPAAARFDTAALGFDNLHEIVAKARQHLNQNHWDYLVGGAETETTLKRNRMALDAVAFRPRVLRDVSQVDSSAERFGRRLRLPVVLSPVGSLENFHREAAADVARAADAFGVAHMLSSVTDPGLEATAAAAPDALRFFQLYVRGDDSFVDEHVERAIEHGYSAFCFTVDTAHYSRRERDLAKRYQTTGRRRVEARAYQMALEWRTVKRVKERYKIPLMVKGIATPEDAQIALDHGIEWIYVSNHGGRQLDHGRGSIDVLPEIVQAVGGRARLIVDGGFYRGTDIVKALALGADLVGMGRMQCYGLAAAGAAGIVRMLELIEDEVQRCLGLLGVAKLAALDRSYLHLGAPVVTAPHVLSAFPLLKVDDWHY